MKRFRQRMKKQRHYLTPIEVPQIQQVVNADDKVKEGLTGFTKLKVISTFREN